MYRYANAPATATAIPLRASPTVKVEINPLDFKEGSSEVLSFGLEVLEGESPNILLYSCFSLDTSVFRR